LPLTPYDVLRLKKALKLHSDAFLVRHVVYALDPASGFPVISLRMNEDPEKACPFASPEGCRVYADRPTACRLFPLGRASGFGGSGAFRDQFFFLQDLPGCLGREEAKIWSVAAWLEDQGVLPYIEINDRMLDLLFHPRREKGKALDDRQLQNLIVACYNLDVFRDFVLKEKLVESSCIDPETGAKIKTDDTALLTFGFAYLKATLFR
jgi:Fe-S-cluster containining protein